MTLSVSSALRRLGAGLAALAVGAMAFAQPLSQGWEVLGTVEATIGDTPATFLAVRRTDTGETTLRETRGEAGHEIAIGAMTPGANGEPGLPILSLRLGPVDGIAPAHLAIDLREAERVLMANEWSETDAVLSDLSLLPDGTLGFAFEAELIVMTPSPDGGYVPLHGAVGQKIAGRFDGRLPNR
jgi:hypothetical protein